MIEKFETLVTRLAFASGRHPEDEGVRGAWRLAALFLRLFRHDPDLPEDVLDNLDLYAQA